MKFEFSMDVKGVPTARVDCKFECTPDELTTLISDPVYQSLGAKFINEVSFAPKSNAEHRHDDRRNDRKQDQSFNGNRKANDRNHHQANQHRQNEAVRKVLKTISTRFDAIKKNSNKAQWGELD